MVVPAMPLPEPHGNEILVWHRWVREQLDFFPRKPTKNLTRVTFRLNTDTEFF